MALNYGNANLTASGPGGPGIAQTGPDLLDIQTEVRRDLRMNLSFDL
jgi:hypothetical protein